MERTTSQREQILAWLKAKKTIGPYQAFTKFGCLRLSERIREIEKEGYLIEHKMIYEYPVKYCRQEIKADLDLVKYLHKNESDPKLKARLAMLGSRLNNIFIHI